MDMKFLPLQWFCLMKNITFITIVFFFLNWSFCYFNNAITNMNFLYIYFPHFLHYRRHYCHYYCYFFFRLYNDIYIYPFTFSLFYTYIEQYFFLLLKKILFDLKNLYYYYYYVYQREKNVMQQNSLYCRFLLLLLLSLLSSYFLKSFKWDITIKYSSLWCTCSVFFSSKLYRRTNVSFGRKLSKITCGWLWWRRWRQRLYI